VPDTSVPMKKPMAQNGNTPNTPTARRHAICSGVKPTFPNNMASVIKIGMRTIAVVMAMIILASRDAPGGIG